MRGEQYFRFIQREDNLTLLRKSSVDAAKLMLSLPVHSLEERLIEAPESALSILGTIKSPATQLVDMVDMPEPRLLLSSGVIEQSDSPVKKYAIHATDAFKLNWRNVAGSIGAQVLISALRGKKPHIPIIAAGEIAKVAIFTQRQTRLAGSYSHHEIFVRQLPESQFTISLAHEYGHALMHYLSSPFFSTAGYLMSYARIPPIIGEGFAECLAIETGVALGPHLMRYSLAQKRFQLNEVLSGQTTSPYFNGTALMYLAIEKHGQGVLKDIARGKFEALLSD